MNVLECYIEEIYEERELTPEEWSEWKAYTTINPDDIIFVHWKYNCYGSCTNVKDYMRKSEWEEIKKRGYDLR